ncbi:MAG: amino acid permease, partial [bacterium]
TTGLIFVSYLGITQLAAISEEVKDPSRNLPRAFIGSVFTVTLLYVGIMFVVNGLLPIERLIGNEVPLIDAAEILGGTFGRIAIILAGFFATVSTANAAILSSSRFPFAMGRDKLIPEKFVNIHQKYGTPSRAIIITGLVMILFVVFFNVEQLAKLGSTFNVLIFALINLSTIILRKVKKDWYNPTFRDPLFPYTQIFGIVASLSLIPQLGILSFAFSISVFIIGFLWYVLYGKKRARLQTTFLDIIDEDVIDKASSGKRKVMVPIASPEHEKQLIRLACFLGERIIGLEIHKVPPQTGLSEAKNAFRDDKKESVLKREFKKELMSEDNDHKYIEVFSHNVSDTILDQANEEQIDLLIMGFHGGGGIKKIVDDISYKVMSNAKNHLAILKGSLPGKISKILIPYGGGDSSNYAINLAILISEKCNAEITLLRNIRPDLEAGDKKVLEEDLIQKFEELDNEKISYVIKERFSTIDAILEASSETDLMIVGDTNNRFKFSIIGNMAKRIVSHSICPVVLVKRYRPLSRRGIMSYLYWKKQSRKKN